MTSAPRSDGGRSALAGFLYQILGVSGLRASIRSGATEDPSDLDLLVTLVRNGRIEHEAFDQDAVITSLVEGDGGISLVQFKYSGSSPPRVLYQSEFNEIIEKLALSEERAEAQSKHITRYYLLTNRLVNRGSEPVIPETEEGSATSPDHSNNRAARSPNSAKSLNPTGRGRRSKKTISSNPRVEKIRREIVVNSALTMQLWIDRLSTFAATLGCLEHEINEGIDKLVGRILRDTAGGSDVAIEEAQLREAFTGCRTSQALSADHRNARSLDQLDRLARLLHPRRPVRRSLLDELDREIRQRALVILEGPGGSGKSTALVDWARRIVESPSPKPGALTSVILARDIPAKLITDIVGDWFDIPPVNHVRRTDPIEVTLDRLKTALPKESHPVLIIGLDGVDEGADLAHRLRPIREALRWFWEEDENAFQDGRVPRATLVITTRERSTIDTCLDLDLAGPIPGGRSFHSIQVSKFTSSELLIAAHQDLAWSYRRIHLSLLNTGQLPTHEADYRVLPPPVEGDSRSESPVNLDVLESLRHPAMWHALINLEREVGSRVLDGEPSAVATLAHSFTYEWFCRKARRRRLDRLSAENIVAVLGKVAHASQGKGETFSYQHDWSAHADSLVGANESRALYKEAISAGYIDEVEKLRWRWRHRICVDYLVSSQSPEEG
jgi:hypothetical protein